MKLIIKKSIDNQYFYVLTAANNKVLLTSETYKRKPLRIVQKLIKFIKNTKVVDLTINA